MVDDDPAGVARLDVDGDGSLSIRDVALLLHGIKEKAHDFSRGMNTTIHHTNHERLESLSLPR
jgi:hypothetical protein